mgnify:CR=1 FL=1
MRIEDLGPVLFVYLKTLGVSEIPDDAAYNKTLLHQLALLAHGFIYHGEPAQASLDRLKALSNQANSPLTTILCQSDLNDDYLRHLPYVNKLGFTQDLTLESFLKGLGTVGETMLQIASHIMPTMSSIFSKGLDKDVGALHLSDLMYPSSKGRVLPVYFSSDKLERLAGVERRLFRFECLGILNDAMEGNTLPFESEHWLGLREHSLRFADGLSRNRSSLKRIRQNRLTSQPNFISLPHQV